MTLVNSTEQVEEIIRDVADLRPDEDLAIDTETTGTSLYTVDEIRGLSLTYRGRDFYIPLTHPDSWNVPAPLARRLGEALTESRPFLIFHNALFDWKSVEGIGAYLVDRPYWDTQLVSWAIDENTSHRLKDLGAMHFGEDAKEEQMALKELFKGTPASEMYKQLRAEGWPVQAARMEAKELAEASRKTWATLTAEDIAEYAAKDTNLTKREKDWQVNHLGTGELKTDPSPDLARAHRFQQLVYRMIERGVVVDVNHVVENRKQSLARMWEIEPTFEGVNLNSPKQLVKLIYGEWGLPIGTRTKKGNPSTSREALEELGGAHEGLDLLLEYRKLAKRVGTYYDNILANLGPDGRIHPGYCVTCTVTGRLSSRAPNLMNIPRDDTDPEVKKAFTAPAGMELVEFDLKSAELFVGAAIAQDWDMLGALSDDGRDFHTETSMAIFGNAEAGNRTLAKNMNYGIPYGIGPRKFATYLVKGKGRQLSLCKHHSDTPGKPQLVPGVPCDACRAGMMIRKHRLAWPRTHLAIDRLSAFARKEGYLPLAQPGRFRHFRSPGRIVPYYTAFNAAVQGGVAEVMKSVMLEAEGPAAELGAEMVLQVHDSLWFYTPPGLEPVLMPVLQEILNDVNPYRAPLSWDSKAH